MANTNYPVSGATDKGARLKQYLINLMNDWDGLTKERGIIVQSQDLAGNSTVKTVTGAVTSGGLIKLTVTAHGYSTGAVVVVNNVGGTLEANGVWTITVIDVNNFTLNTSVFTNAYTSGGTVQNATVFAGVGQDYFLGADANAKTANATRGFTEMDACYNTCNTAIRQMISRLL
jgi:hypothetical protein